MDRMCELRIGLGLRPRERRGRRGEATKGKGGGRCSMMVMRMMQNSLLLHTVRLMRLASTVRLANLKPPKRTVRSVKSPSRPVLTFPFETNISPSGYMGQNERLILHRRLAGVRSRVKVPARSRIPKLRHHRTGSCCSAVRGCCFFFVGGGRRSQDRCSPTIILFTSTAQYQIQQIKYKKE